RRRHTRFSRDWSSDVCSSDLRRQSVTAIGFLTVTVTGLLCDAGTIQHGLRRRLRGGGALAGQQNKAGPLPRLKTVEAILQQQTRSEERRVGKGGRSRRAQAHA